MKIPLCLHYQMNLYHQGRTILFHFQWYCLLLHQLTEKCLWRHHPCFVWQPRTSSVCHCNVATQVVFFMYYYLLELFLYFSCVANYRRFHILSLICFSPKSFRVDISFHLASPEPLSFSDSWTFSTQNLWRHIRSLLFLSPNSCKSSSVAWAVGIPDICWNNWYNVYT